MRIIKSKFPCLIERNVGEKQNHNHGIDDEFWGMPGIKSDHPISNADGSTLCFLTGWNLTLETHVS